METEQFAAAIDCLNNQLEDLSVGDDYNFSVDELIGGSPNEVLSEKYLGACKSLLVGISHYDGRFAALGGVDLSTTSQIMPLLQTTLPPAFDINADRLKYRIIHYLCTVLQMKRMIRHNSGSSLRRQKAADTGKVVFQLDKICRDLGVHAQRVEAAENDTMETETSMDTELSILESVIKTLRSKEGTHASSSAHDRPKQVAILSKEKTASLNPKQIALLENIRAGIRADFHLRRKMLMKRCDVTIQTFLWAEKAIGKEGEIVAAIQAQRAHLVEDASNFGIEDALAAPISLLYEHTKKVTEQSDHANSKASLVKKVLIGKVPDRGGRANEMRPKLSDINPFAGKGGGGSGSAGGGGGKGGGHGGSGGGYKGKGPFGDKGNNPPKKIKT